MFNHLINFAMQNLNPEKIEDLKKKLGTEGTVSDPPTPPSRPDAIVIAGGELVPFADGITRQPKKPIASFSPRRLINPTLIFRKKLLKD